MKFLQQTYLLLWKNIELRKRKKIRLIAEIVWPLFLFIILLIVRLTKNFDIPQQNCYFTERPLPSNGLLRFFRTFICDLNYTCFNTPRNNNYDPQFYGNLTKFISDLERVKTNEYINSPKQQAKKKEIISALAKSIAISNVEQGSNETKISSPIEEFLSGLLHSLTIDQSTNDTLTNLWKIVDTTFNSSNNDFSSILTRLLNKTIEEINDEINSFINPIFHTSVNVKELSKADESTQRSFIKDVLCNTTIRNNQTQQFLDPVICNSQSSNDFLSEINFDKLKEILLQNPFIAQIVDIWNAFVLLIMKLIQLQNIIVSNEDFLNSLNDLNITKIMCGESPLTIFSLLGSVDSRYFTDTLKNITRKKRSDPIGFKSFDFKGYTKESKSSLNFTAVVGFMEQMNNFNNKYTVNRCPVQLANMKEVGRTCFCQVFYYMTTRTDETRILWNQLKPMLWGKIPYTPNKPAFTQLIKSINSTFETIKNVQNQINKGNELILRSFYQLESIVNNINSYLPDSLKIEIDFAKINETIRMVQTTTTFFSNLIDCTNINKFEAYNSEEELVKASMNLSSKSLLWGGIVFDDSDGSSLNGTKLPNKLTYKIRMNPDLTHNTFYTKDLFYSYGPNNCITCNVDFLYGFIFMQDMIEKGIIEMKTNQKQEFGITTHMTPYPCYIYDGFTKQLARSLPLFMVLAWIFTVSMAVKDIVYEKEKRLKEFMRVMGLSNLVHWVSWFITTFVIMMFVCILLIIILKYGKIAPLTDFSVLLVFFCCFSLATISQCFLISVFFSRANLAAATAGILYFVLYLPYTVLVNYSEVVQPYAKFLASLSSTVAFGYGSSIIGDYEVQRVGVQWSNFYSGSQLMNTNFSMNYVCLILLLDAIIYLIFTWYIETIAPGELGIRRPFYFPLQPSYWFGNAFATKHHLNCDCCSPYKKLKDKLISEKEKKLNRDGNFGLDEVIREPVEPGLTPGIEIINMHKIYSRGNNHALKGLTLNFYENEISSFLGHNGAGKSTCMSILTGLYEPTFGTARINGLDITKYMNKIRNSLGFVPQYNVLFDGMTVANHLWFYARLKGMSNKEAKLETEKLLVDTGLVDKRKEIAKNLSGGMQRKLSVAIAFVGGSKIVILDEPSAGVDPKGRRGIWDLLFKYKPGRTIVISTHHMDEADILGDRISIIANGSLVSDSTSYFLKQKFGRGYYLTLAKKTDKVDENTENRSRIDTKIIEKEHDSGTTSSLSRDDQSINTLDSNGALLENIEQEQRQIEEQILKYPLSSVDEKINQFVKSRIPNSFLVKCNLTEVVYSISNKKQDTKNYGTFFNELEMTMNDLGIDSVGISDTTLEEIFIRLARQPEKGIKASKSLFCSWITKLFSISYWMGIIRSLKYSKTYTVNPDNSPNVVSKKQASTEESSNNVKFPKLEKPISPELLRTYGSYTKLRVPKVILLFQQVYALLLKRFHRVRRNVKGFFAEIILPIIFVCLALIVATTRPKFADRPPIELHPWLYGDGNKIFYSVSSDAEVTSSLRVENVTDTFFANPSLGTRCMNNHTITVTTYNDNSRTSKNIRTLTCAANGYTITRNASIPANIYQALLGTDYFETKRSPDCPCNNGFPKCQVGAGGDIEYKDVAMLKTKDYLYNLSDRNISDWLIKTEFNDKYFQKRYGGFEFTEEKTDRNPIFVILDYFNLFANGTTLEQVAAVDAIDVNKQAKVWYNNKGYFAHVSYLNTLNNALLRSILKSNKVDRIEDFGIIAINHPLGFTNQQFADELSKIILNDVFVAICVIFALSFIPASFLIFLVEERALNSRQLQFVSGVKPYLYWISNFIWDIINYVIPCLICIIIFLIFNVKTYIAGENIGCLILLMLFYGWAVIPLVYLFNYMFQVPSTAFVISSCFNIFVGIVTTMSTSILDQLAQELADLKEVNDVLKPLFLILFPHYCLGRGIVDMSVFYNVKLANNALGIKYNYNALEFNKIGKNILALFVQGIVFFILNLLIQYKFFIRIKPAKLSNNVDINEPEDDDVHNERLRLLNVHQQKKDAKRRRHQGLETGGYAENEDGKDYVRLINLTKVYRTFKKCAVKKHVAVNSLCVGINKGECFGLIGVNGAGKTTTFKMLTGEIPISSGDAYVNGYSVSKQIEKVHQNIGYCPQQDAIFPLLTASEHLHFYARLRGIPEKYVSKVCLWALNRVGLGVFANRVAGVFSGGNKRKLSTAIALVGDPSVIYLDEPTSGMDAKARRLLWDDITNLTKENRIVVLTSHNMEECETMCTRLVIMVNGKFKCIGSPQHLKSKFGSGYKLTVRLFTEDSIKSMMDFMREKFPSSQLDEQHKNLLVFKLFYRDTKLSNIFEKIEKYRDRLNIKDYSISQTTLDQIFVDFAKEQHDDPIIDNNNNNNDNTMPANEANRFSGQSTSLNKNIPPINTGAITMIGNDIMLNNLQKTSQSFPSQQNIPFERNIDVINSREPSLRSRNDDIRSYLSIDDNTIAQPPVKIQDNTSLNSGLLSAQNPLEMVDYVTPIRTEQPKSTINEGTPTNLSPSKQNVKRESIENDHIVEETELDNNVIFDEAPEGSFLDAVDTDTQLSRTASYQPKKNELQREDKKNKSM